ncbi:MAG: tyrosine-protein kinase Etk/Wzc [Bacteroidota bacterium]|nr:tyrosine-protein kinase Etk/Wzc [Bacteroidota bacterium]
MTIINKKINEIESTVKRLPDDQQELIKIKRKYDLNEKVYSAFLQKRSEADIVKAANLSDIHFIDPAKEVSANVLSQKTSVNYVLALFIGLLVPLTIILIIFFLNNTILNSEDIHRLTTVPLIGVVGVNTEASDLAVFDKPKSAMAESFRGIRSSLQFLYKGQGEGAKVLMLTSSISGEGKTFCSINIATVFALSEKKTIIVGLDLRKPKLSRVFEKNDDFGAVNYLINQKNIDEIISPTTIPFLDIIFSGPIPPNPSELILNDKMSALIQELKTRYDYIILDTPPVGLVSDATEISQFADVVLYIVRQNHTKKEMVSFLNNRVKRGELKNTSIILNGFENKAKYGYSYGYYGYGDYANGYHEEIANKGNLSKIKFFFKKIKIFKRNK